MTFSSVILQQSTTKTRKKLSNDNLRIVFVARINIEILGGGGVPHELLIAVITINILASLFIWKHIRKA